MSLIQTNYTEAPEAAPNVMIIFGAGGDLTRRKLIPALFHLAAAGLLPESFAMLGLDRLELDDERFRDRIAEQVKETVGAVFDHVVWQRLVSSIHYMQIDMREGADYEHLCERLGRIDAERGTDGNYLFYLAVPPSLFGEITDRLGEVGLLHETEDDWRRVIIEKPFGHDLESAIALNREMHRNMDEEQIYRIDHYLGKETVQNIMVFRFANSFFEPLWNRNHIDHVQITVAESVGVEHRGAYYEEAGALRDMLPNHLLVLLGFLAMDPPSSFESEAVRIEINKVLDAVKPLTPEEVLTHAVRGQYGAGTMPGGEKVPAYRASPDVNPRSYTETYAALKLSMDSWRWAGVPFYLRTGKRLTAHYTEVAIQFKRAPTIMFKDTAVEELTPDMLVLRIQPNEGIQMSFGAKVPGPTMQVGTVNMDFCYEDYFGNKPATGYETLIYDCMNGDATLFKHADTVEKGWEIVQSVMDVWAAIPPRDFPNYAAGSWGPAAAGELTKRDGRLWRRIAVPKARAGSRSA
ncbi:glucose-6-phosphate 1-dehydrogenase [Thioflavicoccus mobilis 8321]|uniref:Glucose-6-phosphate 1-dehydrogenase n=1 Tax=Thioflavicoccus mobilis 8321 TaxID=765912 RepID=L0H0Y9_9GAMM|nr:glucose-6-phosphate dehydrogenase [Thioflavicoccus mobilis]AGA91727.1 glucose-6-phosphate 1-dehydrogenase [Thioflavicoccus mobilis 8321]